MNTSADWSYRRTTRGLSLALAGLLAGSSTLVSQVVSNLQSFTNRIPVGDPLTSAADGAEGPKGIATADFNGDGKPDIAAGNLDGTITVLMGEGSGRFSPPIHLNTGADELRAVLATDLNGDGRPDLAAASPMDGRMMIYLNNGGGGFGGQRLLPAWRGVRNLAAGDFDGDGIRDLAAAGPGMGLRHYRGTGAGNFEIMGDLPRLSEPGAEIPRPVYTLRAIRSLDGLRDDLLLTHAESPALYVLSTVPANRSAEPPVNPALLPDWRREPSPVVITEVQVNNSTTLRDADGEAQPWLELLNKSAAPVNLAGWVLAGTGASWQLPAVTLEPGRFLVIFLSGKNRDGAELHAGFLLDDDHKEVWLSSPGAATIHRLALPAHNGADISTGLAMDVNRQVWFDLPSPGAANNAGFNSADSAQNGSDGTTLSITPLHPAPGQPVTISVRTPAQAFANTSLRAVWLTTTGGAVAQHHLLRRTSSNQHSVVLPAGTFSVDVPHRVVAKYLTNAGVEFTEQIHPGLDGDFGEISESRAGRLLPVASVPSPKVRAFEIGVITQQLNANAAPDLVYADDVCGLLRVHRAAPTAQRFQPIPSQDMQVRGSPRDVKLADLDGDGWLDALTVLRQLDLALVCRNESGRLKPKGELPTGSSPREAVMADFSGDGKPDAAVINRTSADISILTTGTGVAGLVSHDQVYPVDGEVSGLNVLDYNKDGRDDVVQLHRASGEISVRYSNPDGTLQPAVFLPLPAQSPSGMTSADVNGDSVLDLLTANLGFGSAGSISIRLSKPGGSFVTNSLSGIGAMFAISVADLDGDTKPDLIAGLFDCRIVLYRGDGMGGFTFVRSLPFTYESRVMVTADFDQDGDIDVAGAGNAGDVVVLENTGTMLTGGPVPRTEYRPPSGSYFGTERIGLTNMNVDADPDLVVGTGRGCMVYLGGAGMAFHYSESISNSTPGFSVSDVVTLDLDGNGTLEMIMACREASCVNILTQAVSGEPFTLLSQADVPSGRYLAKGDLDADGKPDLIGTGDVLWTVLSSRPPQLSPPASTDTVRETSSGVLINEVLTRNTGTPVALDNNRSTDFIELFNNTSSSVDLSGWKLRIQSTQDGAPFDRTVALPAGTQLSAGSHRLVLFGDDPTVNSTYAGFTLPAEPGTVSLLRPDNTVVDSTRTPDSLDNVSWSRFRDGHPSFRADGIPSPGMSNLDNGSVAPEVKLTAPSPRTMLAGQPLPFTARGNDDSGIVSLSLLWKPVGSADAPERVILYDDGMHNDRATVDGFFAGQLAPGLPAGTEVQFYLEATDLSGNTVRLPENAELTGPGQTPVAWTFSLSSPPALAISEISPNNYTVRDEIGGHPDFIRVRNTGSVPVNMDGVLLAKSPLSETAGVYAFPSWLTLAPGEQATVFADDDQEEGAFHAPFTLDTDGDDIALLARTASGARQWIHSLTLPPVDSFRNSTFQQIPGSSLWGYLDSTPPPAAGSATGYDETGASWPVAWAQTINGRPYSVEGASMVAPGENLTWTMFEGFIGNGAPRTVTHTEGQWSYIRIVPSLQIPSISSVRMMPHGTGIQFEVKAPNARKLEIVADVADRGTVVANWPAAHLLAINGSDYFLNVFNYPSDVAPRTINWRIRVSNEVGEAWSAPATLVVPPAGTPKFDSLSSRPLWNSAALTAVWGTPGNNPTSVTFIYDTVDKFGSISAWAHWSTTTLTSTTPERTYSTTVTGLTPGVNYYGRAVAVMPNGFSIISAAVIRFRGANEKENIASSLRLTEVMYHPSPPTAAEQALGFIEDDFEWIELYNDSPQAMDLSGTWFSGISLDFPASGGPVVVQPYQRIVIAAHPYAFAARYGSHIPVFAWTLHPYRFGRLSNGGETLLLNVSAGVAAQYTYNDWSFRDDGGGSSLDFESGDPLSSRVTGGTPGQTALPIPDQSFTSWRQQAFTAAQLNIPAISGADADPDGDRLTNSQEYIFGTLPFIWDPQPLQIKPVTGPGNTRAMQLTFPVNPRASVGSVAFDYLPTAAPAWINGWAAFTAGLANFGASLQLTPEGRLVCVLTLDATAARTLYRLRSSN